MSGQLISLLERSLRPRILVVGDVMLDRYVWGDVERISPEAPIPVLRVSQEEHRLGGAASVASMLAALEAETSVASVTGGDFEGVVVRQLLERLQVDADCMLVDPDRITTLKERLLGRSHQRHPHHMMRVDREETEPINEQLTEGLLDAIEDRLDRIDLILVSDYNKGVCRGELISRLVPLARTAGVRVLADPVRGADYRRYAGCACITPNRLEAAEALGTTISTPQDGLDAARALLEFGVDSVAVTMDRDGIAWADREGNLRHFPCRDRQVSDITGAGDMVLSAIGYSLAVGADHEATVELANLAGGLEVERLGVVPLTRQELLAELTSSDPTAKDKILPLDRLLDRLKIRRHLGQRIAMTNGCYDLLHPGHVESLRQARSHGDCLVVGLNSDRSVRQLKGPDRPVIDQRGRAEMLAALECVDHVVIFDETSVESLVEAILPDVLVKASQYAVEQVVGHEIVQRNGGRVVTVPMKPNFSTTRLIEKTREPTRRAG